MRKITNESFNLNSEEHEILCVFFFLKVVCVLSMNTLESMVRVYMIKPVIIGLIKSGNYLMIFNCLTHL